MAVTSHARMIIERSVLEALAHDGKLGTKSLRLSVKQRIKRPPITDRRMARICSSLLKQGIIEREEVGRKSFWTLKQY